MFNKDKRISIYNVQVENNSGSVNLHGSNTNEMETDPRDIYIGNEYGFDSRDVWKDSIKDTIIWSLFWASE